MRLIDADAYLKKVCTYKETGCGSCRFQTVCPVDEPTIDAVPAIRCKDCKHYDGYFCHNKWWGDGYGSYTPPIKKEDGFCDWWQSMEKQNESRMD